MMRKTIYLALLAVIALLSACEQDLPVYSDTTGRLYFKNTYRSDTLTSYSFAYHGDVTSDTVWLTLQNLGFIANHDRAFELQQVMTGKDDAVAGKHYVSFDDAEYKKLLVIKADSTTARIPVVMLRDASLKTNTMTLKFTIKENADFKSGFKSEMYHYIQITDRLSKPNNWGALCNHYFGTYGPVRHQFMIKVTGDKWDEEYISEKQFDSYSVDQAYMSFICSKLAAALKVENAERAAQGLSPLAEEDGTLINFAVGGY